MKWTQKVMGKLGLHTQAMLDRKVDEAVTKKFDLRYPKTFTDVELKILEEMSQSTDSYTKVLIANICIRLLSEETAKLGGAVILQNTSKKESVEGHIVKNKLFNSPNQLESGFELMRRFACENMLDGNGYLFVMGTPQLPLNIDPLFSRLIEPIPGGKGEPPIKQYKQKENLPDIEKRTYEPEEIIHVKSYNPASRIKGLSWLTAMDPELEMAQDINAYQKANYKEGFFPSLVLNRSTEMQELDETQKEAFRNELYNKKIGPNGERYLLLQGIEAKPLSFSPSDLQVLQSERFTAAMIATGLKIPAELLGPLMDKKNVATYKEALRQLYDLAAIPLLQEFLTKFNHYFFPDGGLEFAINRKNISVFQKDATELNASWWIMPDKKLELQGYAPTGLPEMQEIYIPAGFVNIKDLGEEKADKENL